MDKTVEQATPANPIEMLSGHLALYHPVKRGLQSACQFVWIICYIFSTRQKLRHSSYADDVHDPKPPCYLEPEAVNTILTDKTFGLLPQGLSPHLPLLVAEN